jgi:hypothetical protein
MGRSRVISPEMNQSAVCSCSCASKLVYSFTFMCYTFFSAAKSEVLEVTKPILVGVDKKGWHDGACSQSTKITFTIIYDMFIL